MSKITLAPNASGSGTLTIAAPNTNTDRTLTLPDATGTVNISGLANEVPAGSAGSPSIYSTGDSNTGVFFPAADTVAVSTAGTERLRVDSSGNVGIGVTPSSGSLKHLEIGAVGNAITGYPADAAIYVTSNAVYASGWKYALTGKLATRYAGEAGQHQWFNAPSGTAGNAITFTRAMTLDASGNLGIGTTSPAYPLTAQATASGLGRTIVQRSGSQVDFHRTSIVYNNSGSASGAYGAFAGGMYHEWGGGYGVSGGLTFATNHANAGPITFATADTERMRIDSSGNVSIGGSIPGLGTRLAMYGGIRFLTTETAANTYTGIGSIASDTVSISTSGTERMSIGTGGVVTIANLAGAGTRTVTATATGVLAAASDSRLKQEVPEAPIAGLAEIMQLRPVAYKWLDDIANRGDEAAVELGFFADEAKDIIPSAAPMGNDGYYGFYDRAVIAALTKAVQEQQQMIQALQADIAALKGV
jgi:hypothetical protein